MNAETRTCQNCKQAFVIEPDDFAFYKKINVPPPTFCPECRLTRRLVFRNERSLYKRKCDLCRNDIVAVYPDTSPFPVYCGECWFSDRWDPLQYGSNFDPSVPFFLQFKRLLEQVPRLALEAYQNEHSPYTNYTWFCKNVYLSSSTMYAENIAYGRTVWYTNDAFDCHTLTRSELCYEVVNSERCARSAYLLNARDCLDSFFLYDCADCTHCFLSTNLRHKSYVFRNKQLSREEYFHTLRDIDLGSFVVREKLRADFAEFKRYALHRFAHTNKVMNVTGNNIKESKNAYYCFDADRVQDVRYVSQGLDIKDSADLFGAGDHGELLYEGVNIGYQDSCISFSLNTYEGMLNVQYCDYCRNAQYLFGCVGVRKKQHCVLNKQYSAQEYGALTEEIMKQMTENPYKDARGRVYRYGEFFPAELSPFAYNETIAQEYFPLTKEEALTKGYRWREPEAKSYAVTKRPQDLPDHIKDVGDDVLNDIIGCSHEGKCHEQCTTAFKIIPQELQFYRRMNLPVPRLCPNCRHYERLKQRNPLKLWHRQCVCLSASTSAKADAYQNTTRHFHGEQPCPNEFETSYAPERPEIVYCEACYNAEVA